MKIEEIKILKLIANEGKSLTNGEAYSKSVYLGVNDSPDNWTEINDDEIPEIIDTNGGEVTE